MKPLILFSLTNGWGIRNFVHSGLLSKVSEFADVAVATSTSQYAFYEKLLNDGKINHLVLAVDDESPFWRLIRKTKKGILQAKFQISTAKIKTAVKSQSLFERRTREIGWKIAGLFTSVWQIRLLEKLEYYFKTSPPIDTSRPFKLFINCSPFDGRDNQLQRNCQKQGVPSIAIIPSWDNPSTKGCLLTSTDIVLVWGENQKNEIMEYYPNISESKIKISGIPQFDAYRSDLSNVVVKEEFLKNLGIPADQKVILYATCSESLFPMEPEVVSAIVDSLNNGELGLDTHLLIRCHPADRVERYEHLCTGNKVTISPSKISAREKLADWIPVDNELDVLAATLRHCSVCVNTASTMILDALACDKPVVCIGYSPLISEYLHSPIRYYDYLHLKPIALSGAVPIVRTPEELVREIKIALSNPDIYFSERTKIVKNFCPHLDIGSIESIVGEIKKFCI